MVTKYYPRVTVFMKPASEHNLINRRSSGRFANLRFCSRSRFPRACSQVRSGLVVVDKSVGATMVSGLSFATSLTVLAEQSEIREASSSHISATDPIQQSVDHHRSAQKVFHILCFSKFLVPGHVFIGISSVRFR